MSWLSKITGGDAAKRRREQQSVQQWGAGNDPGDQMAKALLFEQQGGGWEQAFNQTAGSFLNQAMPQLRQQLQTTREDAIRRGVSTGDLGTTYEGNIMSAFNQNLSNTLGGLASQEYDTNRNRYLDLLTGTLDRNQSAKNSQNNMWASLGGDLMKGAAMAFGA